MAKLISNPIVYLIFGMIFSQFVLAEDSFFDDEVLFEDSDQQLVEWSDESDLFSDEVIEDERLLSWLNLGITQKWGFNPASDWNTTKERTELTVGTSGSVSDSGYGEVELKATKYWPSDSYHSTLASDVEVERAFLQFSFGDWSTKLGRYTIGWGELEGGALDVINPVGSLTDPTQSSQWLMSATRYWSDRDLSIFYSPNPIIQKTVGIALTDDSHRELGVRYGINQEGGDMAVYGAYLIPNNAVTNISNSAGYAGPYQLLGFSMNKAYDNYLLKFDLAYKHNLEHNRLNQFVEADRLDLDVALDIQQDDRQWLFSINSKYWLDYYSDYISVALPANVSTRRNSVSYLASVSDTFSDEDWSWNLSNIIADNGDMSLLTIGLDWDINDQWKASINALHADAELDRAFSLLDGYERLQMEVQYQY